MPTDKVNNKKKNKKMDIADCPKCNELVELLEQSRSGWKRALADYQNLQRETEMKRKEWAKISEKEILEKFIPVYDNFKKAFAVEITDVEINKQFENWRNGIGYIMKQFLDILNIYGIEEQKTKFNDELE